MVYELGICTGHDKTKYKWVDMHVPSADLYIEVNGSEHYVRKQQHHNKEYRRDVQKLAYLTRRGHTVLVLNTAQGAFKKALERALAKGGLVCDSLDMQAAVHELLCAKT